MSGVRRFRRATRGQASVLGVALMLGIALVGASAIVVFGASALDGAKHESEIEAAEHVMTQFDSQVSLVALGESERRTVSFGRRGGEYNVYPNAGTIRIVHLNYDGVDSDKNSVWDGPNDTDDVAIYNASMGSIVYENEGTAIAYQGGGVWRQSTDGASRMVSPPEFHYRGATLTFPVIRVVEGSGGSGDVSATISPVNETVDVYPNTSRYYTDDKNVSFTNPADDGQVIVTVQSEYYEAWAEYFRDRTEGKIELDHANETVTVKLISTGITGQFEMPNEGSSLNIQGIGGHSMSDFSITLVPDDSDSAKFNNLQWSMYAEDGDKQFELHLRKSNDNDDSSTPCKEVNIAATVYYAPPDGDSNDVDRYHGWRSDTAYTTECYDADGDGTADETRLIADFVDDEDDDGNVSEVESGDPMLPYGSLSKSATVNYDPQDSTLIDPITFDEHKDDVFWESKSYTGGDYESIDRLINHYFSLMDRVELTVTDKDSNTVTESGSAGNIQYVGGAKYITFLHITENEVRVEFQ